MKLNIKKIFFQWEAKVERSQAEFDSISNVIKKELELFEATRVKEFKKVIVKYLESLLSHQQDVSQLAICIILPTLFSKYAITTNSFGTFSWSSTGKRSFQKQRLYNNEILLGKQHNFCDANSLNQQH